MQKCRFCGIDIYFDRNIKSESGKLIPIEVRTNEKHDCVSSPKHPDHKKYFGDDTIANDNPDITKMLDAQARHEFTKETLKPKHESEMALRQQIDNLKRDFYSKDIEFQDYKAKTDAKIKQLESRLRELENKFNRGN